MKVYGLFNSSRAKRSEGMTYLILRMLKRVEGTTFYLILRVLKRVEGTIYLTLYMLKRGEGTFNSSRAKKS